MRSGMSPAESPATHAARRPVIVSTAANYAPPRPERDRPPSSDGKETGTTVTA